MPRITEATAGSAPTPAHLAAASPTPDSHQHACSLLQLAVVLILRPEWLRLLVY